MSTNKILDVDIQICMGMMRLSELTDSKLIAEKMSALIQLSGQIKGYQKEFNNNPLALDICAKKIEFILQAKSKSDLKEILSPPKIRYYGGEIIPVGKFHVEKEELFIWSLTSLWSGGPLIEAGFKRFTTLMKKFYPEYAGEIGID